MPTKGKKPIEAGDYFLLPFAGAQRDLLVQAVERSAGGHWTARYPAHPARAAHLILLSSCHRCSPAKAARILGVKGAS